MNFEMGSGRAALERVEEMMEETIRRAETVLRTLPTDPGPAHFQRSELRERFQPLEQPGFAPQPSLLPNSLQVDRKESNQALRPLATGGRSQTTAESFGTLKLTPVKGAEKTTFRLDASVRVPDAGTGFEISVKLSPPNHPSSD